MENEAGLLLEIIKRVENKIDGMCKRCDDHAQRIKTLERDRWIRQGVVIALTGVISFIGTMTGAYAFAKIHPEILKAVLGGQ